jgi:hypothetical protein
MSDAEGRTKRLRDVGEEIDKLCETYRLKVEMGKQDDYIKSDEIKESLLDEIQAIRHRVAPSIIDDESLESTREFRQQIDSKLALKREKARENDFWWTPPAFQTTEQLLADILKVVDKELAQPSKKVVLPYVWQVVKDLIYLAVIAALLLSAHSQFELRVLAILILIYSNVVYALMFAANASTVMAKALDGDLGRIGRALGLTWLKPQDADTRKDDIIRLIHTVSISIGTLCAMVVLIASFFAQ